MKFRNFIFPIVIILIGTIFSILGALFTILHWQLGPITGGYLLAIGSITEIIGVIVLIIILLRFYFRKR